MGMNAGLIAKPRLIFGLDYSMVLNHLFQRSGAVLHQPGNFALLERVKQPNEPRIFRAQAATLNRATSSRNPRTASCNSEVAWLKSSSAPRSEEHTSELQ